MKKQKYYLLDDELCLTEFNNVKALKSFLQAQEKEYIEQVTILKGTYVNVTCNKVITIKE